MLLRHVLFQTHRSSKPFLTFVMRAVVKVWLFVDLAVTKKFATFDKFLVTRGTLKSSLLCVTVGHVTGEFIRGYRSPFRNADRAQVGLEFRMVPVYMICQLIVQLGFDSRFDTFSKFCCSF